MIYSTRGVVSCSDILQLVLYQLPPPPLLVLLIAYSTPHTEVNSNLSTQITLLKHPPPPTQFIHSTVTALSISKLLECFDKDTEALINQSVHRGQLLYTQ